MLGTVCGDSAEVVYRRLCLDCCNNLSAANSECYDLQQRSTEKEVGHFTIHFVLRIGILAEFSNIFGLSMFYWVMYL